MQVEVVDAAGNVVPTASNLVTFTVQADEGAGSLVGTANGDPSCLVNNLSPSRPAFHGLVLGVLSIGDAPGLVSGQPCVRVCSCMCGCACVCLCVD